jgi:hypothetical protein
MALSINPITSLPQPPLKTDPTNFAERADSFLDALPDFVDETNAAIAEMNKLTSGLDQQTPISAYNSATTYNFPDVCAGSDGYSYRCVGTDVVGIDPVTDGGVNWVNIGGGGGLRLSGVITSATTMAAGTRYLVDTTSGALTLTLPSSPSDGDSVGVVDVKSTFDTNPVTIARAGNNIMGLAEDMVVSTRNASFVLTFIASLSDWRITEATVI